MITITNILEVEKHIDGLDAVIFDLDDTLYLEEDYVKSGYKKIAALYPQFPEMYNELWNAFTQKQPAIDIVLEKYNLTDNKDDVLKVYRFQEPDIVLDQSVKSMLDRIASSHKIGIITDGRPEGQRAKLKALGLMDLPFIITDELGGKDFRKPCPVAFEKMAANFGVALDKCAYVGDNIIKDFISPDKLGMRSIYYKNEKGLYYKV